MPSRRAAVFVVSPSAVYSRRRSEPTWPDITWPLLRPMPILKPSCRPSCAQPLVEALEAVEHVARGGQRAVGVVVLRQRRAEHGHDAVAHVGHERAAVVEDRLAHRGQVAVQGADDRRRLERLGERGEAAQVAEHDRALALHAAEADPVGAAQHLVDDGLGDEAREGVARLLALEGDGDAVDRGRWRAARRSRRAPGRRRCTMPPWLKAIWAPTRNAASARTPMARADEDPQAQRERAASARRAATSSSDVEPLGRVRPAGSPRAR